MDDLTKIVLTAAGTLTVAVVAALLGAWIQSRREQQSWVRERRFAAYLGLARVAERLKTTMAFATDHMKGKDKVLAHARFAEDIANAFAEIDMVGPKAVVLAAKDYIGAALDDWQAEDDSMEVAHFKARAAFNMAVREELKMSH